MRISSDFPTKFLISVGVNNIFGILCQVDYKKIGLVPQKLKAAIEHEW
jgi:hypothetical protein